jgi:hypothetical protein
MRDYRFTNWVCAFDDKEITLIRVAMGMVAEGAADLNDRWRAEAVLEELEAARQRGLQNAPPPSTIPDYQVIRDSEF